MQERDWESINYYNNRIGYCSECLALDVSSSAALKARLARLESAKKKIGALKDAAWDNRAEYERKKAELDCQLFWNGKERQNCSCHMGEILEGYRVYCRNIDRIEDALIDEITGCKNRIAELESSISWLEKVINDCRGWLNKLWN